MVRTNKFRVDSPISSDFLSAHFSTGLKRLHIYRNWVLYNVLKVRRGCGCRISWFDIADLTLSDIHDSGDDLIVILHILIGDVQVKSIGLINGRVGILLSYFGSLFCRRGGYVSSQIITKIRLTFTILILGHPKFFVLEVVAQGAFALYVVVNAAQKLEVDILGVVEFYVILVLIDNFGKLHDLRAQNWFKFNNDVIKLQISMICNIFFVLRKLDAIQYFNIYSLAVFVILIEIPLF